MRAPGRLVAAVLVVLAAVTAAPGHALDPADPSLDPEKATLDGSPLDDLPHHIQLVSPTGMRPTWSPDGGALLYLDAPLGDVWQLDLRSGARRNLTGRFATFGFLRAHYLASGDLVLCGPAAAPDPEAEEPGRFDGVLWALPAPYNRPPVALGRPCYEGIAVSRTTNRIAWNESAIDFTADDMLVEAATGKSEIWTGEVVVDGKGGARLVDQRLLLSRYDVVPPVPLEAQDFTGPSDTQLVFTAYGYQGGEVMRYDSVTGQVTNHSNRPFYEEAEGTAPDGSYVLVERDLMVNPIPGALDFWRLSLSTGTWQRLTHFNRYRGYGASNPVVSPDGRSVTFQLSLAHGAEGEGQGLLVMDLAGVQGPVSPL